jgi:hypothetical protein
MIVGKDCTLINGDLAGITGIIIAANYVDNYVLVRVDKWCKVETIFENIQQVQENDGT